MFIRVPKDQLNVYWHKPWDETVMAAESQLDGLRAEAPPASPWPWHDGGPQRSTFADGPEGDRLFAERDEKYQRGRDAAYLREGDGRRGKNVPYLFQQNW